MIKHEEMCATEKLIKIKHYECSSNCELMIISYFERENRTLHLTEGNVMFCFTET
jgi:hypothetical protein